MPAAFVGLLALTALQRPVLQDYAEWLWQARLWSAPAGPSLRPVLNLGFILPYGLAAQAGPVWGALSGYLLWGLGGAWLFRRRGGEAGLSTFLAFLAFPSFYWTGNIAFLNACLAGFLFLSACGRPGRPLAAILWAALAACLHGAVGIALLVYTAARLACSYARPAWREERRFVWPLLVLLGVFAAAALAKDGGAVGVHVEWGGLPQRLRTLGWAFSPLSVPDAVLLSPWRGVFAACMALLLAAALAHWVRLLGAAEGIDPAAWASAAVLAAGLVCPLLAFEVVRLDLRLLFCGYAFGLYGLSERGRAQSPRFAGPCFLAVALGVLLNLHYDLALRRTVASADAFLGDKTVLGAYMEPYDGDRLSSFLPNYTAHKFFFNYPRVAPMPQYVFHTLFTPLPRAEPDGSLMYRLSRPIEGYPQTVCVVYRDR